MYRRLLTFLRPHWWRMAGNIVASIVAAVLGAFMFTLLIPFVNHLFKVEETLPAGWIGEMQGLIIGMFSDPSNPQGSLNAVIVAILVLVLVKNAFVWWGGLLGASLQEYVTRDLRDG